MKNLKTFLIPAALLFMGVGSAFATHYSKASKPLAVTGFYYDISAPAEKCIEFDEVDCNETTGPVCTELVGGVSKPMQQYLNSTECGDVLHRN